jgi:DNA-binding PadR family transcriptional regulator
MVLHPALGLRRAALGTAIQDDVRELSGGGVRLWPATLYGSLEELVEQGWLEEVPTTSARRGSPAASASTG